LYINSIQYKIVHVVNSGSYGCELQVLIDNAFTCGMEAGTRFNLTKYSSYMVDLGNAGIGSLVYNITNSILYY